MPKQVIVQSSIEAVDIIHTPIPDPQAREVIIQVKVSGTNPKDWKYPLWKNNSHNSGDDIAGIVYSVGKDVYEFKTGDRVAAFHEVGTKNGSFAEYAVAPDWTTFHLPHNVSFEEAATIPLASLTAAIALFVDMKLPALYMLKEPADSGEEKVPILIYGVTSAVGAFAAKYSRLSGFSPIIGIAGRAQEFAKTLADYVIDYRDGEDVLVAAVEEVLAKERLSSKVPNVFDAISENGTLETTLRFLDPNGGTISTALPTRLFARDKGNFKYPPGVKAYNSAVVQVHSIHKDFGYIWSRYLGRLLEDGRLKGHPFEVIPGGLQNLKNEKASGSKYIYRIEDTEDASFMDALSGQGAGGQSLKSQSRENSHPMKDFPFPSR
ncbi:related to NADPH:quinone reductase and related Zn-dependent oxidoreductases [Phialocephala subalpina]|uniref:Related to NADPH:quinone reductase and related Zn-dependent oxidoreductases n=1 Tax=Phialocephala subalpina TaxID=576137 RepID=A0A1L7XTH1_9HELO|nr:related to NADPH:quinone reductase and related Zn-dependent oxidoreductases [Phialocephala subalpina]